MQLDVELFEDEVDGGPRKVPLTAWFAHVEPAGFSAVSPGGVAGQVPLGFGSEPERMVSALLGLDPDELGQRLRSTPEGSFRGRVEVADELDVAALPLLDPEDVAMSRAVMSDVGCARGDVAEGPRSGTPHTQRAVSLGGGPGDGCELIDGGPYDLEELRSVFATAPLPALAGGWVGCVADALSVQSFPGVGDMVRALVMVASRLHNVRFDRPPWMSMPGQAREAVMGKQGSGNGDQGAGAAVRASGAGVQAQSPASGGKPAAQGFVVHDAAEAPPPAVKASGKPADPLTVAIEALRPGQWLEVAATDKGRGPGIRVAGIRRRLKLTEQQLHCYRAAGGKWIVKREK